MKVKEFIDELSKLNQEAEVYFKVGEYPELDYPSETFDIQSIKQDDEDVIVKISVDI